MNLEEDLKKEEWNVIEDIMALSIMEFNAKKEKLGDFILKFNTDSRTSVISILDRAERQIDKINEENSRVKNLFYFEDKYKSIDDLNKELQPIFNTEMVKNVSLFTVRNANLEDINKFYENKNILLEQISKKTIQVVIN